MDKERFAKLTEDHLRWRAWRALGDGGKLTYLALLLHADCKSGECWPKEKTLAELTGLGRRAIQVNVKRLAAAGMMQHTPGRGRGIPSHYKLLPPPKGAQGNGVSPSTAEAHRGAQKAHGHAETAHGQTSHLVTNHRTDQVTDQKGTDQWAAAPPMASASASAPSGSAPSSSSSGSGNDTPSTPISRGKESSRNTSSTATKVKGMARAELTDDERRWITSAPDALAFYLAFGLRAAPAGPLPPPGPNHWSPKSNGGVPEPGATVRQLAAWAWWMIAHARARVGLPLTLPAWGKLLGAVKAQRAKGTEDRFVALVVTICNRWTDIGGALGRWGESLAPDEGTIGVPQVVAVAERLMAGQSVASAPARAAVVSSDNAAKAAALMEQLKIRQRVSL